MRLSAGAWLRPLAGAVVLALVMWRVGTGPFLTGVRGVSVGSVLAVAAITVVTTVCSAWRWRAVAGGLGVDLPLGTAVTSYYRSQFLNSALPGGVVGDLHRGVRHGLDTGSVGRGLRAVVWERVAGQVVLGAVVLAVLLILPSPVSGASGWIAAVAAGAVVLALVVVLTVRGVRADVRDGLLSRRTWPVVLASSLMVVVGHTSTLLIAARATGTEASLGRLLPLVLLILAAMTVPLNVGGWGPREGAAAWAFAAAGLGADQGVATATAYGVMAFVATLPGALVLLAGSLRGRSLGQRLARAVIRSLPLAVAAGLRRGLMALPGSPLRGRFRRALLRALAIGGIPRRVTTFSLLDDPDLVFLNVDSQVLAQLYWWGSRGWEPELLPWWRAYCRRSRSVLELGANVGYFAVQGGRAAPGTRHVAVEPHPYSAEICRAHLALNAVTSVEVVEAAAVPTPALSSVALSVPADQQATPTIAFLSPDTELPSELAHDVGAVLDVAAIDLASLLEDVDLIKLDVEGQEHVLLAAALGFLRAEHPTLFVEVLPGTPRLRTLLAELCLSNGYRCFAATSSGLVELSPERLATVRLMDEFGCQDVILTAGDLPTLD
jgi:FkbM family methyltransferase